jgi:hypothetical protein
MIRPETRRSSHGRAAAAVVGVFRGASNAKGGICDDANCAWICGVLGKFADAQKADFVKPITTAIKYAPPGYTPPDRKKLDGPLLDVQYQRTKEKVDELLNQLVGAVRGAVRGQRIFTKLCGKITNFEFFPVVYSKI